MPKWLRPHQVSDLKDQKAHLESQLQNPHVQEKGIVRQRIQRIEQSLEKHTPPQLSPIERDKLMRRAADLETSIKDGMPSAEEMRKAPPGALGKHQAWQDRHKKEVLEWKDAQIALNPDNTDPDLCNAERFRPRVSSLNMDGAIIPGRDYSIPSDKFKENYDSVFRPEQHAAEMEALKGELAELRDLLAAQAPAPAPEKKGRGRREWTPEERAAAGKRLAEARKAKQEEAQAGD